MPRKEIGTQSNSQGTEVLARKPSDFDTSFHIFPVLSYVKIYEMLGIALKNAGVDLQKKKSTAQWAVHKKEDTQRRKDDQFLPPSWISNMSGRRKF